MIKSIQVIKPDPSSNAGLLLVMLFSIVYTLQLLGFDFILGRSTYWNAQGSDVTQHLSGINMYLSAPWQFPLLAFDSLNYPTGTLITFVDGIPLLAFLLKLLLPSHIGWVNPLGYWLAFYFILQGFSAWWINRELRTNSWLFLVFFTIGVFNFS